MSQKYADIIIDISHEAIDRTFQYIIPETLLDEIFIGSVVNVPFGRGNRLRQGYVIGISETPNWELDKMKEVAGITKGALPIYTQMIQLAEWIRDTYGSTMIQALKTVMPVKETVGKREPKIQAPQCEIPPVVEKLNPEQERLVQEFQADYTQGIRRTYLLHGITGSGKTEVYIQAVRAVVKEGKAAILLIPEIALTYQTVARFQSYFGERVSVIHSKLSKGEKYREFMRAQNGETDVMIGPRSALFAPFSNLGLIILDEEHDNAYKSETNPKYHARETAIYRAKLANASCILGSATPSLESYAKAMDGTYRLWELTGRAGEGNTAKVSIVDLREELRQGNRSILSNELYQKMQAAFERNEQVMLFINKRGYNSFVSCRKCGEAMKCPRCEVSLSLHGNGYLMCHYCGHIERKPTACPKCGSKLIGGYGTGTEKVEAEVKRCFPEIRTLRMDRDTTLRKGAHGDILSAFSRREADCLIGTQMIVKGHDFSNVTVVGIILADLTLFDSDFKASERTFDLLTQAAGRAGRGEKEGCVVIQTYQPEHYAIAAAAEQDYKKFFELELAYRRILKYPPIYHMLAVLVMSKEPELADEIAACVCQAIKESIREADAERDGAVIGPGEAYISKINDVYRRVVYVKHLQYNVLQRAKEKSEQMFAEKYQDTDGSVQYDFDPMSMI